MTDATRYRVIESPVGPLTLAGNDQALTHLRLQEQNHPPKGQDAWILDERAFPEVVDQINAYFAGKLTEFNVTLSLGGTPFQQEVWSTLRGIPFGETVSYGEVAARIGKPTASRAVGLANGRNPVAIIVPCHRVVGSTGALKGYAAGPARKQRLLDLEQSHR